MSEPVDGHGQSTPPRSRLEDEVREILVRADQPTSLSDHVRRKARQRRRSPLGNAARSFSGLGNAAGAGTFLIGGLALAFLATAVRSGSPLLAQLLALASVGSLAMIWVRRYRSPDGSNLKTWRGRDIDFSPPPAWVESLRERFRRPPRF